MQRPRRAQHLRHELGGVEDHECRGDAPDGVADARGAEHLERERRGRRGVGDGREVVSDEKRSERARHVREGGLHDLRLPPARPGEMQHALAADGQETRLRAGAERGEGERGKRRQEEEKRRHASSSSVRSTAASVSSISSSSETAVGRFRTSNLTSVTRLPRRFSTVARHPSASISCPTCGIRSAW